MTHKEYEKAYMDGELITDTSTIHWDRISLTVKKDV